MSSKIGGSGYVSIAQTLQAQANKRKRKQASKEVIATSNKVVETTANVVKRSSFTKSPENRLLSSIQYQSKIEWVEPSLPSSVSTQDLPDFTKQTSGKENATDFNSFSELDLLPESGSFLLTPSVVTPAVSSSPMKTPVKKAKTGKEEVPSESPPLKSPMGYHYGDYYEKEAVGKVNKIVKKFKGKSTHTLASPSAKKDAHLIVSHYSTLKASQKVSLPSPDKATITMTEKDRFVVKREKEGTEREFGVHRQAGEDGEGHARLYPAKGSGFISLSGSELFDQFQEFKPTRSSGPSSIPFLRQVSSNLERSRSISPDDLPPPLPSEVE